VGKIVEASTIGLAEYMQKVMTMLHAAVGEQAFQKPATFLILVTKLAVWYHRHMSTSYESTVDDVLEPMKELKTSLQDIPDRGMVRPLKDTSEGQLHRSLLRDSSSALDYGAMSSQTLTAHQQPNSTVMNANPNGPDPIMYDLADLPTMPWLNDGELQLQTVGDHAGLMTNFTDFDQLWNAGFLDDSPMLMFSDNNANVQRQGYQHHAP
jgi:hypothetical protein